MALTRAALTIAMAGELAGVLTLAGLAATDTAGALKEPLDRCFRALGFAEGDLGTAEAPDGAEQRSIAYASYFVLNRAAGELAGLVDVSTGRNETSAKESQAFGHVQGLLKEARAVAEGYGLPVGPGAGVVPVPYGGGISESDYAAVEQDGDRLAPLFQVSVLEPRSDHPALLWDDA